MLHINILEKEVGCVCYHFFVMASLMISHSIWLSAYKLARPHRGWVKAIREALGMTTAQFAQRMGVSQPRTTELEQAEIEDKITLGTLRRAAEAMNCTLVYISRLAYTILIGNGDMHLKNWSFIYHDGHTPELAPVYDMVSTIPYIPDETLALKFIKTKDMMLCDIKLFETMAEKAELPKKIVLDSVQSCETTSQNLHINMKICRDRLSGP